MNWKHLIWIIPLALFGGFMINYFLQVGLSMLGWEMAEVTAEKYGECKVFVEMQDKCLFESKAESYEDCYWSAKSFQSIQQEKRKADLEVQNFMEEKLD